EHGRAEEVDAMLERELPESWEGLPTRFATTWEPVVRQRVEGASAADFVASRTGVAASRLTAPEGLALVGWLSVAGPAVVGRAAGGACLGRRRTCGWTPRRPPGPASARSCRTWAGPVCAGTRTAPR